MTPTPLQLTMMPAAGWEALTKVMAAARARHERNRKAAKKAGRDDFPALPFECSAAYETQFVREYRDENGVRTFFGHTTHPNIPIR